MEMNRVIQARESIYHQQEEREEARQRLLEARQRLLEEQQRLLDQRQPLSTNQQFTLSVLSAKLFSLDANENRFWSWADRVFFRHHYFHEIRNRDEDLRNLTTEFLKLQNELTQVFLETTRVEDGIDQDEGELNRNIYGPRDWWATWPSIGDGAVSSGHFSKEPASHCFIFVFSMITNRTK